MILFDGRPLQDHALPPGARTDQQQRAVQHFLQAGGTDRGPGLARKGSQFAGYMADAFRKRGDGGQVFLDRGIVAPAQEFGGVVGIGADGGHRLVDFMRHAGGHLSQ